MTNVMTIVKQFSEYALNYLKMKKAIIILLALTIFISVSCNKSDSNTPAITTTTVTTTIVTGSWKITYYWDTDHDETANFSGYSFTFGSSSAVTATKVGSIINGTWATILDDSKTKLILSFATPAGFAEISDDWHVIERTDSKIRLQDVSGGNGGTDYLTFEKN